MKRVLLLIILSLFIVTSLNAQANAGIIADKKAQFQQTKIERNEKKEIRNLFAKQDEYAKKYDLESLKSLYSANFIDNDGYSKDVYFSLVKDTWNTYPNITYTTKIKKINLNGDYATVETDETSVALADDLEKELLGELYSESKCIYHLQKSPNKWEIASEEVLEEFSTLKYGDARYVDMKIEAPKVVGAGQDYTSTLKVNLPPSSIVIASINQEKIVNPAQRTEDAYKKLDEDQTLTRIFTANSDNVNEYTIASVGITAADVIDNGKLRVYMNGLAFVMSRTNVIPKNNFAVVEEKPEEKI